MKTIGVCQILAARSSLSCDFIAVVPKIRYFGGIPKKGPFLAILAFWAKMAIFGILVILTYFSLYDKKWQFWVFCDFWCFCKKWCFLVFL